MPSANGSALSHTVDMGKGSSDKGREALTLESNPKADPNLELKVFRWAPALDYQNFEQANFKHKRDFEAFMREFVKRGLITREQVTRVVETDKGSQTYQHTSYKFTEAGLRHAQELRQRAVVANFTKLPLAAQDIMGCFVKHPKTKFNQAKFAKKLGYPPKLIREGVAALIKAELMEKHQDRLSYWSGSVTTYRLTKLGKQTLKELKKPQF